MRWCLPSVPIRDTRFATAWTTRNCLTRSWRRRNCTLWPLIPMRRRWTGYDADTTRRVSMALVSRCTRGIRLHFKHHPISRISSSWEKLSLKSMPPTSSSGPSTHPCARMEEPFGFRQAVTWRAGRLARQRPADRSMEKLRREKRQRDIRQCGSCKRPQIPQTDNRIHDRTDPARGTR